MERARGEIAAMTAEAETRRADLDQKAEARRSEVDRDFEERAAKARADLSGEIAEAKAASEADATRRVEDAAVKSRRMLDDATAKSRKMLDDASTTAENTVAEANARATKLVDDANAHATTLQSAAKQHADKLVGDAKQDAEARTADATTRVEELRALREQVAAKLTDAHGTLGKLGALLEPLDSEQETLEKFGSGVSSSGQPVPPQRKTGTLQPGESGRDGDDLDGAQPRADDSGTVTKVMPAVSQPTAEQPTRPGLTPAAGSAEPGDSPADHQTGDGDPMQHAPTRPDMSSSGRRNG
jgi:cell division septum initiation protein DivIVA